LLPEAVALGWPLLLPLPLPLPRDDVVAGKGRVAAEPTEAADADPLVLAAVAVGEPL
jgi:hypothetical protein